MAITRRLCEIVFLALLCEAAVAFGEPIRLETLSGTIYGTLEMPTKFPCPVAVIISGSGPTDRDGNTNLLAGKNNSLRMLAELLLKAGVASVRYDKRGIGESRPAGTDEAALRFETYIADAELWGNLLRQDKRFNKLLVIGHSEGSLIGMVAASKLKADGFVSLAGPGRPAAQVIREQLKPKLTPEQMKLVEEILVGLEAGKTRQEVPQNWFALFRPSVQPYLISWFRYDPAKEIRKFQKRALIVQGDTDIQVSVADARALSPMGATSKLLIVEGMNHVLKKVPMEMEQQVASYSNPDLPLHPDLVTALNTFLEAYTSFRKQ